ncbi:hypothetical protein K0651_10235 [Ornithinimicrobium sp. Arc0846-15]|nr:hypothetical protein [Ornithinimicrobium laminariae]
MAALKGPAKWAYRAFQALPAPLKGAGVRAQQRRAEGEVRALPWWSKTATTKVWMGPLNTAGQASAWAGAINQHLGADGSTQAVSVAAMRRSAAPVTAYAVDATLTLPMQLHGQAALREVVLSNPGATHALVESGRPVLGEYFAKSLLDDAAELQAAGVEVALVLHGSEMRDLHAHAERDPHSPFRGEWPERWQTMQTNVEATRQIVAVWTGPVFVTTTDLLDDVPEATLLPVVADVAKMQAARSVAPLSGDVPTVLHAPSNPLLKGSAEIDSVLQQMEDEGLLAYRRLVGVPHAEMAATIAAADIVIDQIVLSNPGVLLAESMAAGRIVVAHLRDEVRMKMQSNDPQGEAPPVFEATPDNLREVIAGLLADREGSQALAARGPAWAARNHDGTRSAAVLADFLSS